ncbi:TPA: PadR family transcriptional regulator [Candidatus Bipolaricaulota bacterium]|nr:PadR family transcriptional regulator [Candidatus Bipolaricaulota bacterium]
MADRFKPSQPKYRLRRNGYIEAHTERVGPRPERRVYRITPEGEEHLRGLLREALYRVEPYYDPLYAALTFAKYIPQEEVIDALGERRKRHLEEIRHLEEVLEEVRAIAEQHGVDTFYAEAILKGGIEVLKAEVEWLKGVCAELERRDDRWNR